MGIEKCFNSSVVQHESVERLECKLRMKIVPNVYQVSPSVQMYHLLGLTVVCFCMGNRISQLKVLGQVKTPVPAVLQIVQCADSVQCCGSSKESAVLPVQFCMYHNS